MGGRKQRLLSWHNLTVDIIHNSKMADVQHRRKEHLSVSLRHSD